MGILIGEIHGGTHGMNRDFASQLMWSNATADGRICCGCWLWNMRYLITKVEANNNENDNDCKLIGMICSLDSNNIMVVVGMLAMKSVINYLGWGIWRGFDWDDFKFVNCHVCLLFIPSLAYAKFCQYNPNVLRVKSQLFQVKSRFVFFVPSKITICWWWHPHFCQENPWIATFFLVTFCKFHVFVQLFLIKSPCYLLTSPFVPLNSPCVRQEDHGQPENGGQRKFRRRQRTAEVPQRGDAPWWQSQSKWPGWTIWAHKVIIKMDYCRVFLLG